MVWLLGGRITIRGLAPAPFFMLSPPRLSRLIFDKFHLFRVNPRQIDAFLNRFGQKNERPVGVPAALAWGMEGT